MKNLLVVPCIERPIVIMCDSTSAIAITKDLKCHFKAKHIEGKYHYVRDKFKRHKVWIERVSTKDNLADPFTKYLPVNEFSYHVLNMGLNCS